MYVVGSSANRVIQYSLSTAFDISSATLLAGDHCTFTTIIEDGVQVLFNSDGSQMFIVDDHASGDDIEIFDLSTNYDVENCSTAGNVDFSSADLKGMQFSNDGKKLFCLMLLATITLNNFHFYNVYNLSNSTFVKKYNGTDSKTIKQLMDNNSNPHGFKFSADGTKMYLTGGTKIFEFSLSDPFDLSNVTFDGKQI